MIWLINSTILCFRNNGLGPLLRFAINFFEWLGCVWITQRQRKMRGGFWQAWFRERNDLRIRNTGFKHKEKDETQMITGKTGPRQSYNDLEGVTVLGDVILEICFPQKEQHIRWEKELTRCHGWKQCRSWRRTIFVAGCDIWCSLVHKNLKFSQMAFISEKLSPHRRDVFLVFLEILLLQEGMSLQWCTGQKDCVTNHESGSVFPSLFCGVFSACSQKGDAFWSSFLE